MGLRGLITNLGVELNPTFNVFSQILTDVAFIFALVGAAAGMFASLINLAGTGMGITVILGTLLYIGVNYHG